MGLQGIPYQKIEVPFAAGLRTKDDPRAVQPPGLTICRDVEFDDLGALRTRYPYLAIGVNILGGGTLSNFRKVYSNGPELICLTVDTLYSWDAAGSVWVPRGTHLAVNVQEATRFASTSDAIDCDRAELAGVVFYVWTNGTNSLFAALDKATGAVILPPTTNSNMTIALRPRLVALQTKVLLFFEQVSVFEVLVIDPANVATSFAAAPTNVVAFGTYNHYYDVTQIIGTDVAVGACRNVTTTAYTAFKVTSAGSVSHVTPARTCDGPIAVSSTPDGLHVQVVRANSTNIQGDLLLASNLSDVHTGQAVGTAAGTPVNQIAAAHRSTQDSGQYRCYAFWSALEDTTNSVGFAIKSNWVDDGGTLGTQGTFLPWCGVASRAFNYNGRIFVWAAFGQTSGLGSGAASTSSSGQLQNAYFLLRDDKFIAAKAVYARGGGLASSTGRLPGVALTAGSTTFSWCGAIRQIVPLGGGTAGGAAGTNANYAQRAPQDITFTIDSNEARRMARLGRACYFASGEILQYDGTQLVEVGFHVYPWYFDAIASGSSGLATGLYGYKSTFRWNSAQGEVDRSTTATVANATVTSGPKGLVTETVPLPITHKTTQSPAVEIWRTTVNPTEDAPFYLVTSLDPNAGTGSNGYLASSNTLVGFNATITDIEADAAASVNQTNPENGAVLANLCPPAASIIVAGVDRLYLAGIAGAPDSIWYSKQRNDGEVAAFNDGLVATVPPIGGAMSGLAIHPQTQSLIAFRQRSVWQLPGNGFDNLGGGNNYGPAIMLSSDVGAVNPDAIAVGPFGIIFQSNKGWYRIDGGLNLSYIGSSARAFDGDTIYSVHVVENRHQVRAVTNNRIIVFDYNVNEWGEWTVSTGLGAALWNGTYVYLDSSNGVSQEQNTFDHGLGATDYGMDVQLAPFKPTGLMGRMTVRGFQILGENRSSHALWIRCGRDYLQDGSGNTLYYDSVIWPETPTVVGGPEQVQHGPSQQRCESIIVRITAVNSTAVLPNPTAPSGEAVKLTGIAFDIGVEEGLFTGLPVAQKD